MTSYLTTSQALALANEIGGVGLEAFLAKDDAGQAGLLLLASLEVDRRLRYQGCKWDPQQEHEFPRVPFGIEGQWPPANATWPAVINGQTMAIDDIWDWDTTANDGQGAAVVPEAVLIAVLYQSNWLAQPAYYKRLEKIRSGLADQSIGTATETLNPLILAQGSGIGLCERAAQWLDKYRLRSGRIL
jgi:hypothetical protein